jgi:hypothetical protein
MTEGHRHRLVNVPSWDTWYVRALRYPLFHCRDQNRVERSPYPYGPCRKRAVDKGGEGSACLGHCDCWTLSVLSVLHRWTGLTLATHKASDGDSLDSGQAGGNGV